MKKVIAAAALVALAGLGTGLPALGDTTNRFSATSVNASWTKSEKLRTGGWRITSWSVYISRGDTSDASAYRDVVRCRRRPEEPMPVDQRGGGREIPPNNGACRVESSASGPGDVSGSHFTIDDTGFTKAHLDSTFDLQPVDGKGNPKGSTVPTHVVVDWSGTGDVGHSDGSSNFAQGACTRHDSFTDDFRDATATGTFGPEQLGASGSAGLDRSSSTSSDSGCPTDGGPIPVDAKPAAPVAPVS